MRLHLGVYTLIIYKGSIEAPVFIFIVRRLYYYVLLIYKLFIHSS